MTLEYNVVYLELFFLTNHNSSYRDGIGKSTLYECWKVCDTVTDR